MRTFKGRPSPFPPSKREMIENAQRGMDFYTASADRPSIALGPPLPPKRSRKPADRAGENAVRNACQIFMEHHPRVAFIGRFNRGAIAGMRNGKRFFHQMNTIKGFPDLHGMTKDGRAIYCETKAGNEKPTEDQIAFILKAKQYGAIAFVAWSVADCEKALAEA